MCMIPLGSNSSFEYRSQYARNIHVTKTYSFFTVSFVYRAGRGNLGTTMA